MQQIVAMTYNVNDAVPVLDTLQFIDDAMRGDRKVLGVQELRGGDEETGAKNKAQYAKRHLLLCPGPLGCETVAFIPDGRAGAVSIFADSEQLRIVPEESSFVRLHGRLNVAEADGDSMVVRDKWLSIAVLEDRATGFRFAFSSTHLIRDIQLLDGSFNVGAPEILDIYDREMDIVERELQAYLDKGYSVVLAIDANWDHREQPIRGSVPDRLGQLGFLSIYSAPEVEDRTPNVKGTHYRAATGTKGRELDAIYVANPSTPRQPFVLKVAWRMNWGPDAPSDHNLVAAGIDAVPDGPELMSETCKVLPTSSTYCKAS